MVHLWFAVRLVSLNFYESQQPRLNSRTAHDHPYGAIYFKYGGLPGQQPRIYAFLALHWTTPSEPQPAHVLLRLRKSKGRHVYRIRAVYTVC